MNAIEQELLSDATGGGEPRLVVRSRTRIDTGRWWRPTPLWLCVMDRELVMLAVSRRRYVARRPLAADGGAHYCHTTGEFVIEPGEDLTFNRFRVTPREALALLDAMGLSQAKAE